MLTPLRDFVLVEKEAVGEKKLSSGLILTTTTTERLVKGTVVAVGEGWRATDGQLVKVSVQAGDQVMFDLSHAVEVKHDEKSFLLVRDEFLVATVK